MSKVPSYIDFAHYLNSIRQFCHYLQAYKANVEKPLCVGDITNVNKLGSHLKQNQVM